MDGQIIIKHRYIQELKAEIQESHDDFFASKTKKILYIIIKKERIILKDSRRNSLEGKISRSIKHAEKLRKDVAKFQQSPWLDEVCFTLKPDKDYYPEAVAAVVHVDPEVEDMDIEPEPQEPKKPAHAPKKRLR